MWMSATCGYCPVHLAEGGVEFHWRQRLSVEAQRERWEVRQGMASLSHPSTSAFSGSAPYAVPLGSPSSTNVRSCVHRQLGAFAEEHQNQVLLHQKQVLTSWLFLKLLKVFSAFTQRAEMWVRIILTFIYSTLLLSGNFGQVSRVFMEINECDRLMQMLWV